MRRGRRPGTVGGGLHSSSHTPHPPLSAAVAGIDRGSPIVRCGRGVGCLGGGTGFGTRAARSGRRPTAVSGIGCGSPVARCGRGVGCLGGGTGFGTRAVR
ncbi:hypothetical protein ACPCSL_32050, partial [Streptomyces griseoincarnatus]